LASGAGAARGATNREVATAPAPAPLAADKILALYDKGSYELVPHDKMRRVIAERLTLAKQTIPHYYEVIDVDMEAVLALRERLNKLLEKENVRLSLADFVMKATCAALLRNPALNARFNAETGQITRYGDVNLGIAVAIPDGLIVPVLRSADQLGLRELRIRSLDLIERARAQRLKREEQTESTFTITSLGSYGVRQFQAIINPPEVGILAVGAAAQRAVVRGGQVVPRTIMTLALSADHRVVDGAVAAEFLTTIRDLLEEPGMMLL
jgi:pyruvate dehydrogenase E2 component (dihydrolipoamide acetyltransferase)